MTPQRAKTGVNDLATTHPELLSDWDYDKNEHDPSEICYSSHITVNWKCSTCGREWRTTVNHRTNTYRSTGCPYCMNRGTSYPEQALFYYVSKCFPDAQSRVRFGRFEADIVIPSLAKTVEYDGMQWHASDILDDRAARKAAAMAEHGYQTLRIKEFPIPIKSTEDTVYYIRHKDDPYDTGFDAAVMELLGRLNATCDVDNARDRLAIQSSFKASMRERSLSHNFPDIAAMWDTELNAGVTPDMVSAHTHDKYWFTCPTCGNTWLTSVGNLTRRNRVDVCPECHYNPSKGDDSQWDETHSRST